MDVYIELTNEDKCWFFHNVISHSFIIMVRCYGICRDHYIWLARCYKHSMDVATANLYEITNHTEENDWL